MPIYLNDLEYLVWWLLSLFWVLVLRELRKMKIQELDCVLVPVGLALMAAYHMWLLYRVVKHPTKTAIGLNAFNRKIWVHTMMQDSKNGILAVQTLRNNIMASTLVATTAIMLCSLIVVLMSGNSTATYKNSDGFSGSKIYHKFVYGDTSRLGFSIKVFSILLCLLIAFLMNVQSVRYFSNASILINIGRSQLLTPDYVARTINRGSYFWSLGLRAFYFTFPLFLWIFGPIPMFLCCFLLIFLLYFIDDSLYDEQKATVNGNEEGM